MKKSIAVILLGSALLLPNNNPVEASTVENQVKVSKEFQNNCLTVTASPWKMLDNEEVQQLVAKYVKQYKQQQKAPSDKPAHHNQGKAPQQPEKQQPVKQQPVKEPAQPATPVTPAKPVTPPAQETTPQTPEAPQAPESANKGNVSAYEQAVVDLTNAERAKAGLKPLQIDDKLMNNARQKSNDMASKNYFSHTSPTYGSPFDQMKANGISYTSAGENIAMGQRSPEEVVKAWMESPGHRQNILTPNFTHIGIGFDQNGNYWTQQFIQK